MTTYNGSRFLQKQLESIINQTYTNLEIIIVDDNSTDATWKILQEYSLKDQRLKLFKNDTNIGFIKNFEKAIKLCSGEYIALSDQDDIWKLNKIELFLNEIKNNVLIYSDAILVDQNDNELNRQLIRPSSKLCNGLCNKAFLLVNFLSGNTLMFKKELVKYILPLPEAIFHDRWIGFVASTLGSITYTDEALTYYRRYADQVTHIENIPKPFNPITRFFFKKDAYTKTAKAYVPALKTFYDANLVKNQDTIRLIKELLYQFENYEAIYFNFSLYKLLKKYENEVFCSIRPSKRKRRAFRLSVGLRLKTLTLFIL